MGYKQQPVDVYPGDILKVDFRLSALFAGALYHVKRHAQHPMAGRRPHDRQRDPEPQVREGSHVDPFKNRLGQVQRAARLRLVLRALAVNAMEW